MINFYVDVLGVDRQMFRYNPDNFGPDAFHLTFFQSMAVARQRHLQAFLGVWRTRVWGGGVAEEPGEEFHSAFPFTLCQGRRTSSFAFEEVHQALEPSLVLVQWQEEVLWELERRLLY